MTVTGKGCNRGGGDTMGETSTTTIINIVIEKRNLILVRYVNVHHVKIPIWDH